jgi:hypothetical protein
MEPQGAYQDECIGFTSLPTSTKHSAADGLPGRHWQRCSKQQPVLTKGDRRALVQVLTTLPCHALQHASYCLTLYTCTWTYAHNSGFVGGTKTCSRVRMIALAYHCHMVGPAHPRAIPPVFQPLIRIPPPQHH